MVPCIYSLLPRNKWPRLPHHRPCPLVFVSSVFEWPRYSRVHERKMYPTEQPLVTDHGQPWTPSLASSLADLRTLRGSQQIGGRHHCNLLEWRERRYSKWRQRMGIQQSKTRLKTTVSSSSREPGKVSIQVTLLLLFECRYPPIIWTCWGERQNTSSIETSWDRSIVTYEVRINQTKQGLSLLWRYSWF